MASMRPRTCGSSREYQRSFRFGYRARPVPVPSQRSARPANASSCRGGHGIGDQRLVADLEPPRRGDGRQPLPEGQRVPDPVPGAQLQGSRPSACQRPGVPRTTRPWSGLSHSDKEATARLSRTMLMKRALGTARPAPGCDDCWPGTWRRTPGRRRSGTPRRASPATAAGAPCPAARPNPARQSRNCGRRAHPRPAWETAACATPSARRSHRRWPGRRRTRSSHGCRRSVA